MNDVGQRVVFSAVEGIPVSAEQLSGIDADFRTTSRIHLDQLITQAISRVHGVNEQIPRGVRGAKHCSIKHLEKIVSLMSEGKMKQSCVSSFDIAGSKVIRIELHDVVT